MPSYLDVEYRPLEMFTHCDGIVLMFDNEFEFFICNPGIRDQIRILPKSTVLPDPYEPKYAEFYVDTEGVGIGYDTKSKDYKIVKIIGFWSDGPYKESWEGLNHPLRVEVFLVGKDSQWREIENCEIGAFPVRGVENHMQQYIDGVYYWCAETLQSKESVVLSFDMENEVFETIPMPKSLCFEEYEDRNGYNMTRLGLFNDESIALFYSRVIYQPPHNSIIDVWVMTKESGGGWTKKVSIGPLPIFRSPYILWKKYKEFLQEDGNAQLLSYNIAANPMEINNNKIINILESTGFMMLYYRKTLSVNQKRRLVDHVTT